MITDQSMIRPKRTKRRISCASLLYKSLDAVLTASLRAHGSPRQQAWAIIRPGSTFTNRISSLANLLAHYSPGLTHRLRASLLQGQHIPLGGYQVRLLAYGSGTTVFLLDNGQTKQVLKVLRRSLGRSPGEAWEVAREYQNKHHQLQRWFNNPYEIVVPSLFLVLHSPLLGACAAAVLQPYVEGKKCDFFSDYSLSEAVQLLHTKPFLKAQWIDFSNRFLKSMEENDTCFDLVGRENLMLVEYEGQWSFKIADCGLFDLAVIRKKSPALYARHQAYVKHLIRVKEEL